MDDVFMREALAEAQKASAIDEVPVGAVIVLDDRVIGSGYNLKESLQDATAHAEMLAIQAACRTLETWRLSEAEMFVTLEPCVMCMGALIQARIKRLIYGCPDPKGRAAISLYQIGNDIRLNHRIEIQGGVMADECGALLSRFFQTLRASK